MALFRGRCILWVYDLRLKITIGNGVGRGFPLVCDTSDHMCRDHCVVQAHTYPKSLSDNPIRSILTCVSLVPNDPKGRSRQRKWTSGVLIQGRSNQGIFLAHRMNSTSTYIHHQHITIGIQHHQQHQKMRRKSGKKKEPNKDFDRKKIWHQRVLTYQVVMST